MYTRTPAYCIHLYFTCCPLDIIFIAIIDNSFNIKDYESLVRITYITIVKFAYIVCSQLDRYP